MSAKEIAEWANNRNPWRKGDPSPSNHLRDGCWRVRHLHDEEPGSPELYEPGPVFVGPYLLFIGESSVAGLQGWDNFSGEFQTLEAVQQFALQWVSEGFGRWCQIIDWGQRKVIFRLEGKKF